MEASNVCALQSVESDAKTNISSSLNAACVTDSETVINSKTDSTLVKEQKSDEELLEGLLTEYYCHVCSSNLLFESNRLAHYEGQKHAQEVKTYLNAVRAELARGTQNMSRDKTRFCELCSMVFSSHVVAKSHYEGKIHAKNLRKQSLQAPDKDTEVHNLPSITQDPFNSDQNLSQENDVELHPDPKPTCDIPDPSASWNAEVDLKHPDKCILCAASFNNPKMALQHYNGRKHQRKKARQELLKELGKDLQQGSSLMCEMCGVSFNSVEMYQAHMHSNKHQIRDRKLSDLVKSQPKVYSTFADELADYIQVQKARGITPKTSQIPPEESTQNHDGEDEVQHEDVNQCDVTATPVSTPNFAQTPHPPLLPIPGTWFPFGPIPSWPPFGWPYGCPPPPLLPCPGSTQFTTWPTDSGQQRRLSTSSACTTSSSSTYSSCSSNTSGRDECELRNIEKRKKKRHRGDRGRKGADKEPETEERRRKRQRMVSEERRREQFVESWEERRGTKSDCKRTRKERTCQQENFEVDREGSTTDRLHSEGQTNVECSESGHSKSAKARKEKKKTKDMVDTRTEEEKLWDDSILGC
ncbi:hypothetical protein AMECASPLE_004237 [Ameca splendens]|uniref:Lysine-rich coiled-coil protein 1 n=1 Tax=Ameca splendens TaxID=208324 RepID=A0ABV0ZVN7_9TELE